MATLGVKLPITRSDIHGYAMIDDFHSLIRQNLKMLILTNPGERVMMPDFGVGIQTYLFQNFSESTYTQIENDIKDQVLKYLPVVSVSRVGFDNSSPDNNTLQIALEYSIPALNIRDLLQFTI
jgi:phage baseplate assembly protein W